MEEEKTYNFYEFEPDQKYMDSVGGLAGFGQFKVVKESKLTEPQKDKLIEKATYEFNNLPLELQNRFLSETIREIYRKKWEGASEETKELYRKVFKF